jgi:hypothetical protein
MRATGFPVGWGLRPAPLPPGSPPQNTIVATLYQTARSRYSKSSGFVM